MKLLSQLFKVIASLFKRKQSEPKQEEQPKETQPEIPIDEPIEVLPTEPDIEQETPKELKMLKINATQLRSITPSLNQARAELLAEEINELNEVYKVATANEFHEFIAQLAHESGEFTHKVENLNYSAQGLANVSPGRYAINPKAKVKQPNALAIKLQRKPEAIANNFYANRMGNGNEASGDGWLNRGGGYIQATGAEMYKGYWNYRKQQLGETRSLDEIRNLVRTDDYYALDISYWIFYVKKGLRDEAISDQFIAITRAINGGTIGLKERQAYYAKAIKVIK